MANPGVIVGQFDESRRRLQQRWEYTATVWQDSVSRQFEHTRWVPLDQQVQATQREMAHLASILAQVQRR